MTSTEVVNNRAPGSAASNDAAHKRSMDAADKISLDTVDKKSKDTADKKSKDAADKKSKDAADKISKDAVDQISKDAAEKTSKDAADAGQTEAEFYTDAERYWATVEATEAGMMGGNDSLDEIEIAASRMFLTKAGELAGLRHRGRALDCGSGIGRVTKKLLLPMFATVDMAEVTGHFLAKAKDYIGEPDACRIGRQFCCGLQDLEFPPEIRYDLVWVQWVIGHLRDAHLIDFLRRAAGALTPNGMIGVKDNVITARSDSEYDFDEQDSSVCRPRRSLLKLFNQAGLSVLLEEAQDGFPEALYPVLSFALVPRSRCV